MNSKYIEIRFHGRGGQGIVTASSLLSQAFFSEGKYPQSVPLYGPQRRGAPVTVFLRVSEETIRLRSSIYNPSFVVVLDDSLIQRARVIEGVPTDGTLLVNTAHTDRPSLELENGFKIGALNADEIAYRLELGQAPYPHINVLMLAAFSRLTGLIALETLVRAVQDKFHPKDNRMEIGMNEAYERTIAL